MFNKPDRPKRREHSGGGSASQDAQTWEQKYEQLYPSSHNLNSAYPEQADKGPRRFKRSSEFDEGYLYSSAFAPDEGQGSAAPDPFKNDFDDTKVHYDEYRGHMFQPVMPSNSPSASDEAYYERLLAEQRKSAQNASQGVSQQGSHARAASATAPDELFRGRHVSENDAYFEQLQAQRAAEEAARIRQENNPMVVLQEIESLLGAATPIAGTDVASAAAQPSNGDPDMSQANELLDMLIGFSDNQQQAQQANEDVTLQQPEQAMVGEELAIDPEHDEFASSMLADEGDYEGDSYHQVDNRDSDDEMVDSEGDFSPEIDDFGENGSQIDSKGNMPRFGYADSKDPLESPENQSGEAEFDQDQRNFYYNRYESIQTHQDQGDASMTPEQQDTQTAEPAIGMRSTLDSRYDYGSYGRGYEQDPLEEGYIDFPQLDPEDDYSVLPSPEDFNAYPPEVQRKILEWTDRDVRARLDDVSRRQDTVLREKMAHRRNHVLVPVLLAVLGIVCAAVTSIVTGNPVFALLFLFIPLAIIVGAIVKSVDGGGNNRPPRR